MLGASDPEWLPSTIVQSSAALVAIVGGLLVARLVGLSAERGALTRRLRDLEHDLESAHGHLHDLEIRRYAWDLSDFLEGAASLYFPAGLHDAEALADTIPHGTDRDERLEFARIFLEFVAKTGPMVRRLYDDEPHPRTVEDVREAGVDVEPMFEPVVDRMLKSLRPRRRDRFGMDADLTEALTYRPDEAGRTVELQRWDTLIHDRDDARRLVRQHEQSIVLAREDLAAVTPSSVFAVLVALGAMVLAGIAFPVIVMAMRWPDLSAPWRVSLVVAFLASVAGVGVFIHRLASAVSPAAPAEAQDP